MVIRVEARIQKPNKNGEKKFQNNLKIKLILTTPYIPKAKVTNLLFLTGIVWMTTRAGMHVCAGRSM